MYSMYIVNLDRAAMIFSWGRDKAILHNKKCAPVSGGFLRGSGNAEKRSDQCDEPRFGDAVDDGVWGMLKKIFQIKMKQ